MAMQHAGEEYLAEFECPNAGTNKAMDKCATRQDEKTRHFWSLKQQDQTKTFLPSALHARSLSKSEL